MRRTRGEAGFSLIEVIAAIAILGIIAGALTEAIIVGLRTTDSTDARLSRSREAQFASAYFGPDVQGAQTVVVPAPSSTPACSLSGPTPGWTRVPLLDLVGDGTTTSYVLEARTDVVQPQSISIYGSPTGGTYTLSFKGETTSPISSTATAGDVAAALNALGPVNGVGGVTAAGGPHPATALTVSFPDASAPQPLVTGDGTELTQDQSFFDGASRTESTTYTSATAGFRADLDLGKDITGENIPGGTIVFGLLAPGTIMLSTPATGTGTGLEFTLHARKRGGTVATAVDEMRLRRTVCPDPGSMSSAADQVLLANLTAVPVLSCDGVPACPSATPAGVKMAVETSTAGVLGGSPARPYKYELFGRRRASS